MRKPRRLVGVVLVAAGVMIAPATGWRLARVWSSLPLTWHAWRAASFEESRLAAYGDCGGRGYGYVQRIVAALPDPTRMPRVRYPDYDRYVRFVLPHYRPQREDRFLIGVEVPPELLNEELIGSARPMPGAPDSPHLSRWAFHTGNDYDSMTGVQLRFAAPAAEGGRIELTLRTSPMNDAPLGRWTVDVPAGTADSLPFRFAASLSPFSVARGGVDFVLEARLGPASGRALPELTGIDVMAIRVDARGFAEVHRNGSCFTAVRSELLTEIESRPQHPWRPWLESVRRVD